MPTARLGVTTLLAIIALALAACGQEEPTHGLKTEDFESKPEGDALEVAYTVVDGERYTATVNMAMELKHTQEQAGRPKSTTGKGSAVLEMIWTMHRASPTSAPSSRVTVRYLEAEGDHAEAFLAREMVKGLIRHEVAGRAQPRTVRLDGGTRTERREIQDMLVSLMPAGFGGSYAWIPPRPVRVGETWRLEGFIQPRGVENLQQFARETGLESPQPTFQGTGILRRTVEEDGETWLEVEIDGLIEVKGEIRKDGERGRIALGDRITGTALISQARGTPKRFDVTHVRRTETRAGSSRNELDMRSHIQGSVVHTPAGK